jgi:hypothetical protein
MRILLLYTLVYASLAFAPASVTSRNALSPTTALFAKSGKKKKKVKDNMITVNRLAYRNYEIVDLTPGNGSEINSRRENEFTRWIRQGLQGWSRLHVAQCAHFQAPHVWRVLSA